VRTPCTGPWLCTYMYITFDSFAVGFLVGPDFVGIRISDMMHSCSRCALVLNGVLPAHSKATWVPQHIWAFLRATQCVATQLLLAAMRCHLVKFTGAGRLTTQVCQVEG
jgi:hypothetical protein